MDIVAPLCDLDFSKLKIKPNTQSGLFANYRLPELIAFCENITERKKAEETLDQIMGELVRTNEKLGVVGSLTRHDVRNKLSAVTGYAYLLKKKHSDQADIIDGLG